MSMCLGLVTLSDASIANVLGDPPLVWRVIAPDDPEAYEEARRGAGSPSLLAGLFGRRKPQPKPELQLSDAEGIATDLDKSWHGIHYLLNRAAWGGEPPLDFLVASGQPVGDIDVGYGPARVFTAGETAEIEQALQRVTDDELRARFSPGDMNEKEIYPAIWDRDPEKDDTLGYLLEYARILRGFLRQAVDRSVGIVVYLS